MADFRKWRMDFEDTSGSSATRNVPDPPGYSASASRDAGAVAVSAERRKDYDLGKKQSALMSRARAPLKQVGFMCFMMYMSGNTIQIFSLMMTISGIAGPIQAILKSGDAFPQDEEGQLDTFGPRLVYCLIHFCQFAFAVYKLNAMGLVPTHASDWVSALVVPQAIEFSSTGVGPIT